MKKRPLNKLVISAPYCTSSIVSLVQVAGTHSMTPNCEAIFYFYDLTSFNSRFLASLETWATLFTLQREELTHTHTRAGLGDLSFRTTFQRPDYITSKECFSFSLYVDILAVLCIHGEPCITREYAHIPDCSPLLQPQVVVVGGCQLTYDLENKMQLPSVHS